MDYFSNIRPRNSVYAQIFPWSTHIVLLVRRGRRFIQTTFEHSIVSHTANIKYRATIGPPAKRHPDGVSLAGRWWSSIICILRIFSYICVNLIANMFGGVCFKGCVLKLCVCQYYVYVYEQSLCCAPNWKL